MARYILDDVRHGQRFLNIYQDSTGPGHTAHGHAQYDQGLCCPFTNIFAIFTLKHENATIHLLYRYIVSHAHTTEGTFPCMSNTAPPLWKFSIEPI